MKAVEATGVEEEVGWNKFAVAVARVKEGFLSF